MYAQITAMDWGNAFVTSKSSASPSGPITDISLKLHLAGDFKKTSKKVTWLAAPTSAYSLTPVVLIEYDYMITKKKLEEDDSLTDVLNPKTEYRVNALASKEVEGCKKWDIIQFERKGFYICQGTKDADGRMEFGFIPEYVQSCSSMAGGRPCSLRKWPLADRHSQSGPRRRGRQDIFRVKGIMGQIRGA